MSIPEVQLANEVALGRSEQEVRAGLMHLWDVMDACITAGCSTSGVLPGGLRVRRRANRLHRDLVRRDVGFRDLEVATASLEEAFLALTGNPGGAA